jgi:hypothetical protein
VASQQTLRQELNLHKPASNDVSIGTINAAAIAADKARANALLLSISSNTVYVTSSGKSIIS